MWNVTCSSCSSRSLVPSVVFVPSSLPCNRYKLRLKGTQRPKSRVAVCHIKSDALVSLSLASSACKLPVEEKKNHSLVVAAYMRQALLVEVLFAKFSHGSIRAGNGRPPHINDVTRLKRVRRRNCHSQNSGHQRNFSAHAYYKSHKWFFTGGSCGSFLW